MQKNKRERGEMADAKDLKSFEATHTGSTPVARTICFSNEKKARFVMKIIKKMKKLKYNSYEYSQLLKTMYDVHLGMRFGLTSDAIIIDDVSPKVVSKNTLEYRAMNRIKEIIEEMNLSNLEYNATIRSGAVLRLYFGPHEISFSRECLMIHRLSVPNDGAEMGALKNIENLHQEISKLRDLNVAFKGLETWWKEQQNGIPN